MRIFLAISGILAAVFGAALLSAPAAFYASTGVAFTPLIGTIAQAHGATLVGLGLVNFLARSADRTGIIAVLGGNLVAQVLSLAVAVRTMSLASGAAVAPGIVIHVVLGLLFAFFLVRAARA